MNMYIQVAFSISSRVDLIKKKSQHADCDRLYTKAVLLQKKKKCRKKRSFRVHLFGQEVIFYWRHNEHGTSLWFDGRNIIDITRGT